MVHVETDAATWRERHRKRSASAPNGVPDRIWPQWETPDWTEAHQLEFIQN